ncbi:MAG: hypothetical protein HFG63_15100 [Lachnospiraceae bacterium]|nr:hypothetical protein [Lachnospiraceae bacterium]
MEFINEAERTASIHLHELTAGQAGGKGQKKERSRGMTELELFYRHVPDIAELVCGLRGMTPDQRKKWKQKCQEYAGSLNPLESEFTPPQT